MRRSIPESQDEFFLGLFQNEHVAVVTACLSQDSGEENEVMMAAPLTFYGYLIHADANFVYLGETTSEATHAIARDRIVALIDTARAMANEVPTGVGH